VSTKPLEDVLQILRHFKGQSVYFCFFLSGISKGKGNYLDEVLDLGYAYLKQFSKNKTKQHTQLK